MTQSRLFAAFFFLVFAFLLYQLYLVFSGFLVGITWAAILALVFYPFYDAIHRRFRSATAAALLMTFLIYLVAILPTVLFWGVLIQQAQTFYETLEATADSRAAKEWIQWARDTPPARSLLAMLPPEVTENLDARSLAVRSTGMVTELLVSGIGGLARNLIRISIDFIIMIIALFFFFRDGERLIASLRSLLPMEAHHVDLIFDRLYGTLSAVVQGMTATAAAQGLLCGVAFWILGVPFSVLLGFAAAFASFVPFGGAAIVWVPVVGYLLFSELWVQAVVLLVWGSLVVGLVDNVLKPWIIGDRTRISPLFLLFGILGGIQVYGVLGVFLGPTLLATLVAFFQIYREGFLSGPQPVAPLGFQQPREED